MPKPEKDDALYLRRRIEAITASIRALEQKRADRIAAYEALTHEEVPAEWLAEATETRKSSAKEGVGTRPRVGRHASVGRGSAPTKAVARSLS